MHVFSGLAIGLIVVAGWALTGLAYDDMATKPVAPISLTYVRPAGDALQWLALFTAEPMPGFGTASVFGALLGACAAALAMGRFRIATFSDAGDTLRNLAGAALMGLGGVMALGCTIGQGHHRRLDAGARLVPRPLPPSSPAASGACACWSDRSWPRREDRPC